jgi:GNAT superfamily N-acetyltransferase
MTELSLDAHAGLPRDLGDGLILRWGAPADTEAVAEHNVRYLSEDPAAPEEELRNWTRDLMRGDHPTTRASDFTVVVDERAGGKIVSSICLISQTWAYEEIPFKVGRPEIVSTDPAYRRRGLVRAQFAAIHARSAARGELLQAITGIPWYYRQYGYAMTLALGGSHRWLGFRVPPRKPDQPDAYRLRPATPDDIPLLTQHYAIHCADSLVSRVRPAGEWRYELTGPHEKSYGYRKFWIVEAAAGGPVGYTEARVSEESKTFAIYELAVLPGHSLRAVAEFLGQTFQAQMDELNKTREKPLTSLVLSMGPAHAAYTALGEVLEKYRSAYAWYIRVPDLPAFLRLIAPVLERRLAASVMAGHTGTLRLNFYHSHLALAFAEGRLTEVGTYTPKNVEDGDARFPDLTFLHVLLGHRTLAEVNHIYADAFASPAAAVLLGILFPARPSAVAALA